MFVVDNDNGQLLQQAMIEVPLIHKSTNCEEALTMFQNEPEFECLVVVDERHQAVGLIMRNELFVKLSVPLIRDLFSHRPITKLMNPNPLLIDLKMDVQQIVRQALDRTGASQYECVIVCDEKVVKGVLTMSSLLELSTVLQKKLRQQQLLLITSSQQSIQQIVHEVERVQLVVHGSEQKFKQMVDMTLEGKTMLSRLTQAISFISSNAIKQQQQMEQLQHSAAMIGKVTKLVQGISEQSHLLALNATIEAARAGSDGRTFSVVATEMMSLANETKQYAEQIKEAIALIVNAIEESKQQCEEGAKLVKQGDELIANAEAIFQELFNMIAENNAELKLIDNQASIANKQALQTMNELTKLLNLQK